MALVQVSVGQVVKMDLSGAGFLNAKNILLCLNIEGEAPPNLKAFLRKEEIERMERYKFEADQKRHLTAHAVLRLMLSKILKLNALDINIATTAKGKPFLPDYPQIQFNYSHSGQRVAFFISNQECGVDVEQMKKKRSLKNISKHYFHPEEENWVNDSEGALTERFFCIWTRKEAFLKATGIGIGTDLNSLNLLHGRRKIGMEDPLLLDRKEECFSIQTIDLEDYALSYCLKSDKIEPNILFVAGLNDCVNLLLNNEK